MPANLESNLDLLRKVVERQAALDIETIGLQKGAGIVELSVYSAADKTVHQFRLTPNLTIAEPAIHRQDITGYKSSPKDVMIEHPLVNRAKKLEAEGKLKRGVSWKDTVIAQVLMDETLVSGKFEREIKGAFKGKSYPGLSVQAVNQMSEGDFLTYLNKIQQISDDADAGPRGTAAGRRFFEEGVEESQPFLRRALGGVLKPIVDEQLVPGRIRTAASDTAVAAMEKDLQKYSGKDIKLRVYDVTPEQLLDPSGQFMKTIDEKAVLAANAQFESKNIGALVASKEAQIQRDFREGKITEGEAAHRKKNLSGIRTTLRETPTTISDIMPISGKAVNEARVSAQVTGDFTGMFRPMLEELALGKKAAVGDVLDILKIQQSFEQKLGLTPRTTPALMSVDVAQRLYGFSDTLSTDALIKKERHLGAYDVLSQEMLTERSLRESEALSEVSRGTARGKELVTQASKRQGDLYKALVTMQIRKEAEPFIQEANILTRLSRAAENIATKGFSTETSGSFKSGGTRKRITPEGQVVSREVAMSTNYQDFDNLDDVLRHMEKQPNYRAANMTGAVQQFISSVNKASGTNLGFDEATRRFTGTDSLNNITAGNLKNIENVKKDLIQKNFENLANRINSGGLSPESTDDYVKGLQKQILSKDSWMARHKGFKMIDFKAGKAAGVMAAGMAAIGSLGLIGNTLSGLGVKQQRGGSESLRTMNYERWMQQQSQFSGLESYDDRADSGFSPSGIGAALRKLTTDFGSPYNGPEYSQYVFEQHKLMRERQRYELQQFAHVHFNPEGSIGGLLQRHLNSAMGNTEDAVSSFSNVMKAFTMSSNMVRQGNKFATEGQYVDTDKYGGLQGQQLFKVDLSKYRISVEDADTIVLKGKGLDNPLSNFFGMNSKPEYKIRLGGIDAPETAHADRAAMPMADQATGRLKALLNNAKNIEVLIDPTNITYGRAVGHVFADGQNVELDLIKSGQARFLNFKKNDGSRTSFDPRLFGKAERLASETKAGIHGHPYFEPYFDVMQRSKQSITFNTMVKMDKLAKNSNLMSLHGLMNEANNLGLYTPHMAAEAAYLGDRMAGGVSADYKHPIIHGKPNAPHKAYMNDMVRDLTRFSGTKGGAHFKKHQRNAGYGKLDKKLSLDTTGTSTSAWSKRKYEVFDRFDTDNRIRKRARLFGMQQRQKAALRGMNESPIGHHRM